MKCTKLIFSFALLIGIAGPVPEARASFHTWKINEVFSDATGTVQFIEFHENKGFNNQHHLEAAEISTDSPPHVFEFGTELPDSETAGRFFLVGTPDFAALPGVPNPDYVVPSHFFTPGGDTITFAGIVIGFLDDLTWGPGGLPTDGIHSLGKGGVIGVASPTPFAVPQPIGGLLLIGGALMLARRRLTSRDAQPRP